MPGLDRETTTSDSLFVILAEAGTQGSAARMSRPPAFARGRLRVAAACAAPGHVRLQGRSVTVGKALTTPAATGPVLQCRLPTAEQSGQVGCHDAWAAWQALQRH
jgi:hypothetical protein